MIPLLKSTMWIIWDIFLSRCVENIYFYMQKMYLSCCPILVSGGELILSVKRKWKEYAGVFSKGKGIIIAFFESGFTNVLMELAEKGEVRLVYV